jgi:hypothetical protein
VQRFASIRIATLQALGGDDAQHPERGISMLRTTDGASWALTLARLRD